MKPSISKLCLAATGRVTAGGAIPPEKGLVRRFWKCSHSRGEEIERARNMVKSAAGRLSWQRGGREGGGWGRWAQSHRGGPGGGSEVGGAGEQKEVGSIQG